jgi:hypothetical protein
MENHQGRSKKISLPKMGSFPPVALLGPKAQWPREGSMAMGGNSIRFGRF